jgi:CTP:molybdopterin cytidylyltransferase MocA
VLLPKAVFLDLGRSKAANLRAFLSPCQTATWELEDPGLDLDIDCPADYEAALALGGGEALER